MKNVRIGLSRRRCSND